MASPFPLNISEKQDSWDKNQILQHLDPSLKLTAPEINKIVAALEYLYTNAATGDYKGNVPAQFFNINISEGGTSILSRAASAVNALPLTALQNGSQTWFYSRRFMNSSGDSGADQLGIITDYFLLKKKIDPVGGGSAVGTGGTPIESSDLAYLHKDDSRNVAPRVYDLGTLSSGQNVVTVINSGPLRSTPNVATIIFKAVQSGSEKNWLYIGQQEEVGSGTSPITSADLKDFPSDPGTVPPEPAEPLWHVVADIAELIARRPNLSPDRLICVLDASDDSTIDFPSGKPKRAYYRKLSTSNNDISDFELVAVPYSGGEAPDTAPKIAVLDTNTVLSAALLDHILITQGKDLTLNPNTQTYVDGYAVAVKNPGADCDLIGTAKSGTKYQVNDEDSVNSGTFTLSAGGTCAIVYSDVTKTFYIDGDVE